MNVGIGFWEFDARFLDSPDGYTVYPTHSTFEDIIVPATKKINDDVAASDVIENCFPGRNRSYDAITVQGATYITAGVNLLAVDEGEDLSEEIDATNVRMCLANCERDTDCNAVSYNKATVSCCYKPTLMSTNLCPHSECVLSKESTS